jgi:hypothetical protein
VAGDGSAGYSGDRGPATSAGLFQPWQVTTDAAGNLLIADTGNNRLRVVAEHTGTYYGQAMTRGDIYTVAGTGGQGFNGNGIPATTAMVSPTSVTTDGAGNLVIASNQQIRVIAEHTGTYYGQAMTAGDIYSVAGGDATGLSGDGGPATSAWFDNPTTVAVDGAGNLIITDTDNCRIRVVAEQAGSFYGHGPMTVGDIYTVAGSTCGFAGDGGPALHAEVYGPAGVALNAAGDLIIADTSNGRIREIVG